SRREHDRGGGRCLPAGEDCSRGGGVPSAGMRREATLGAVPLGDGRTSFRVWAPAARRVAVELERADHPLERGDDGVWHGVLEAADGDDYRYVLDGEQ